MRRELEQRCRFGAGELDVALAVLRRRRRRRELDAALAATLHAAALFSYVRRQLELELDPWHGRGNPWRSL